MLLLGKQELERERERRTSMCEVKNSVMVTYRLKGTNSKLYNTAVLEASLLGCIGGALGTDEATQAIVKDGRETLAYGVAIVDCCPVELEARLALLEIWLFG